MKKPDVPESWCSSTDSAEGTRVLGERIGRNLSGGLAIGLVGPLGAGKTQWVKGLAVGNGLADDRDVSSPTFTLIQEYPGRYVLYHIDVYRLRSPAEFTALGVHEMLHAGSVVVVEWADRVRAEMPEDTLWIEFTVTSESVRTLTFHAVGPFAGECLARVQAL